MSVFAISAATIIMVGGVIALWFASRARAPSIPLTKANDDAEVPLNWLPVLSAQALIARTGIETLLVQLRRETQSEASNFDAYFRPLIETFLETVQLVPASESHHHAQPGGLIVHTIEVAVEALRQRQQMMLPLGAKPEDIARLRHRWTYGLLTAALLHDIGKPLADLKIRYYNHNAVTDDGSEWNPLSGSLAACGAKYYTVDFLDSKDRDYSAHQRVAMMLLPRCVPREALQWLTEDAVVMRELTDYLSAGTDTGTIAGIIKAADKASVKLNLLTGPRTRFASARTVPLIERLMEALRRMLAEGGTLPLNRNGAAGWVYQGEIYFVARRLVEEVRNYLRANESGLGIPGEDKNDRIFDVWQDYGAVVIDESTGRSVWQVSIEGFSGETFKIDRMSVLRFPLATLFDDPEKYPKAFIGRVNIVDGSGTAPTASHETPAPLAEPSTPPASIAPTGPAASPLEDEGYGEIPADPMLQAKSRSTAAPVAKPRIPLMEVKDLSALPKALRAEAEKEDEKQFLDEDDDAAPVRARSLRVVKDVQNTVAPIAVAAVETTLPTPDALPDVPVVPHYPEPTPLHPQPPKVAKVPTELAMEILYWLREGLVSGALVHNVKDGVVHFVDEGLLLVSPRFFRSFATQKLGADGGEALVELEKQAQRALVAAGWTLKAKNNQNIIPYAVASTTKVLNGMVIAKAFANAHIVEIGYTNQHLKRIEPVGKPVAAPVIPTLKATNKRG